MNTGQPEQHLKREVGFLGLLAMCVGLNVGGALFALTTVAAGLSGPALPAAMLISAVPILLAVLPYVALTSVMPTTSATYRYSQLFSPALAAVSMLTLLACILIGGQPLFALAFGRYLGVLVPADPIPVGILVLTVFYLLNLAGVKPTAWVQTVLFFVLLSALVMYIALGLPAVRANAFSCPFPNGLGGVLAASGLLFTFSAGGVFVIDLGGEVIQARRAFARALPLGIGLAVVLYVLVSIVTVGVVDDPSRLEGSSLIAVAEHFMSRPALAYFIVGGALVACATTINVIFTIISRGLLVVSQEGILPGFLGRVNRRFGTPHWGLTASYLVCVASLAAIPSLMFFGSMLNLGLLLSISVVILSALVFPARFPDSFRESLTPLSPRSMRIICSTILVLNTLIFGFFMVAIGKAAFVFLGIVLACCLYARSRKDALNGLRPTLGPAQGSARPSPEPGTQERGHDEKTEG